MKIYRIQFVLFAFALFVAVEADHCVQKGPCSCMFDTGFGYDLASLGTSTNYLATDPLANNLTYYFHPCRDITIIPDRPNAQSNCKNYSLCVYNATSDSFNKIGKAENSTFKVDSESNVYIVLYHASITSVIQLGCTNIEGTHLFGVLNNEPNNNMQTHLILYSKHACLRKLEEISTLSTGSVLIVTVLIILLLYLVLGITVNYFLIGARGVEVVPHLAFWQDFPALVLDGAIFLQHGCKVAPSDLTHNQDSYTSI